MRRLENSRAYFAAWNSSQTISPSILGAVFRTIPIQSEGWVIRTTFSRVSRQSTHSCQWGSSRQGLQVQRLLPLVLSALLTAFDTNPPAAAAPSGLE